MTELEARFVAERSRFICLEKGNEIGELERYLEFGNPLREPLNEVVRGE